MTTVEAYVDPPGTVPKSIAAGSTVAEVTVELELPLATSDTNGVEAASLVNVTAPVTAPDDCGAKETFKSCVAPGASTSWKVGLVMVKPLPLTVAVNTVVLLDPGFDICTVRACVDPRLTFPKNRFVGEMLRARKDVVLVPPAPVRDRVMDAFDAFEVNRTFALAEPTDWGANVTVIGTLLPAARVIGNWLDGTLNSGLSAVALETTRLPPDASPELETWTVLVDVVPVCTVPKSSVDGTTVRKVRTGAAVLFDAKGSKSAYTDCGSFKMIVQAPVPEHAPDQPLKVDPLGATAVSVTDVPLFKVAEHCVGQLIPTGLLVTVPVPVPVSVTTNGGTT